MASHSLDPHSITVTLSVDDSVNSRIEVGEEHYDSSVLQEWYWKTRADFAKIST